MNDKQQPKEDETKGQLITFPAFYSLMEETLLPAIRKMTAAQDIKHSRGKSRDRTKCRWG